MKGLWEVNWARKGKISVPGRKNIKAKKDRSTASIKDLKAACGKKKYRRKSGEKWDSRPEKLDQII